jgi:2,3-bisphosphoglycerate-dependent phosphoglycerate mutase
MPKLILLRHGQSQWNVENRFTGWIDVDLSDAGVKEAHHAGALIREAGLKPEIAFTSYLKRAIKTLWIVLEDVDRAWVPVYKSWRLNERHYGALQGLNKTETAAKHGEEQVKIWRRSYSTPPPLLPTEHPEAVSRDVRYQGLSASEQPQGESLKMTVDRMLPYWESTIAPALRAHETVLVAAHGNSLRALIMHLDKLSEEKILETNVPTGVPLVYELSRNLEPIHSMYLGNSDEIKSAQEAVANQGKNSTQT